VLNSLNVPHLDAGSLSLATTVSKKGTSAHIPCVSLFCHPLIVARFHTVPEQEKNWTPKQSIPEQHGLFVFNLFFNPKLLRPTEYRQSMSNTKLKSLFCIPTFCWAEMAICPICGCNAIFMSSTYLIKLFLKCVEILS
jgi:hypothetical protein